MKNKKVLYEEYKYEFLKYVSIYHELPKVWDVRFSDNTDMRLWYDKVSHYDEFFSFKNDVKEVLDRFNYKILDDSEKSVIFMNYVKRKQCIPMYGEEYFSDNSEMNSWYRKYILNNREYEKLICESLDEYQSLDLAEIWSNIKGDFIKTIKAIKRKPRYGEFIVSNGVDVRVIFDKLATFDPKLYDMLLLYVIESKSKGISFDERESQLVSWISLNGYIPELQEARFSDGVDMFTWYMKYRNSASKLRDIVENVVEENSPRRINIYLIPEFRNKDGRFYAICSNTGEKIDISGVSSFAQAKKIDPSLSKIGGITLKKSEKVGSIIIKEDYYED